jgi:transposase-like protein
VSGTNPRKVTPEMVATMVAAYDSGLSLREIGAAQGVSHMTVKWHLTRAGTKMRPRGVYVGWICSVCRGKAGVA